MQSKTEMQQGWEFAAGIMGADIAAHMGREYVSAIEAAIKQLEENINNHQYRNEPPQIVRTAQKTPPKQGYEILSNILAPKFHRCQFCFSLDTLVVVEIDIIVNQFSSILESLNFHSMYTLSL